MGLRSLLLTVGMMLAMDAKATINTDADKRCLALTAYSEARDQGEHGMALVMHTVINRAKNRNLTICQAAYQKGQYHGLLYWPFNRTPQGNSWSLALELTDKISLYDFGNCLGATHFYAPALVGAPRWSQTLRFKCQYRGHRFYGK